MIFGKPKRTRDDLIKELSRAATGHHLAELDNRKLRKELEVQRKLAEGYKADCQRLSQDLMDKHEELDEVTGMLEGSRDARTRELIAIGRLTGLNAGEDILTRLKALVQMEQESSINDAAKMNRLERQLEELADKATEIREERGLDS